MKQNKRNGLQRLWTLTNYIQAWPLWPIAIRVRLMRIFNPKIDRGASIGAHTYFGGNNFEIGKNVVLNIGCFLDGSAPVIINDFVRIGPYVRILTGSHSVQNSVIRRGPKSVDINLPVVIGKGCWIGMGASILPGVEIGEGCVIAAGALVNKSTEPNGLYVGTPAKRIRDLSTEDDLPLA
jgi:maltose O-acetyltransferase